jgi:hypothetical protein
VLAADLPIALGKNCPLVYTSVKRLVVKEKILRFLGRIHTISRGSMKVNADV